MITAKEKPFKKVVDHLIDREKEAENPKHQFNYLKMSKPKSHRYLNSKALFDRLLKAFSHVLKLEWPHYHSAANKENVQDQSLLEQTQLSVNTNKTAATATSTSNPNNLNNVVKFPICEEFKTCVSNGNQLRIGFKWRGTKHKDVDVVVLINLGVKYVKEQDNSLVDRINESLLYICNEFFEHGGFFKAVNRFDMARMEQIVS